MNCLNQKLFFHFPKQYLGCKIVSIKDKPNIISLFTNCVVRFVLVIENVALAMGNKLLLKLLVLDCRLACVLHINSQCQLSKT